MEKKNIVIVEQTYLDGLRHAYDDRKRRHDEIILDRIAAIVSLIIAFVLIISGIIAMCIILYTGAMDNIPFIKAFAHGATVFCMCTACGLMFCFKVQNEANRHRQACIIREKVQFENLDDDDSLDVVNVSDNINTRKIA